MSLTDGQLAALETTERIASCFSVIGTMFIFITFVSSSKFRRPINRLVFYASWGNTVCNIATLMSRSPIGYGNDSHLCQFQAFLIQMFVPADAYWNLAMAFNVYLTLFRKYNSSYLKSLEWRYLALCYGIPFIIAIVLLFPSPAGRGKIYGDAVLWCWIDEDWDFLRVALCYAPAWVCILASMAIYILAGKEIFNKRQQLRAFRPGGVSGSVGGNGAGGFRNNAGKGPPDLSDHGSSVPSDDSKTVTDDNNDPGPYSLNYKTTDVEITSTIMPLENIANALLPETNIMGNHNPRGAVGAGIRTESTMSGKVYEQYSVNIGAQPMGSPKLGHMQTGAGAFAGGGTEEQAKARRTRAAVEANRAAWGYTKVALLFFVSLLVTWVPSSVNRVYALTHPGASNIPLAFAAGIVLSLMGFWNSVIYIVTSRAACKELFVNCYSFAALHRPHIHAPHPSRMNRRRSSSRRIGSDARHKNDNNINIDKNNDKDGRNISGMRMASPIGNNNHHHHHRGSGMKPRLDWEDDMERLHEQDEGETRRSEGSGGVVVRGGGPTDLEMGRKAEEEEEGAGEGSD